MEVTNGLWDRSPKTFFLGLSLTLASCMTLNRSLSSLGLSVLNHKMIGLE